MKITPECVPCLLKRVLFQSELVDNGKTYDSMKKAMEAYVREFREGRNSADVATHVHRASYSALGVKDPYLSLKIRADEVAEEYVESACKFVESSDDRIKAAVLVSTIGNIMDFGMGHAIDDPEEFRKRFWDMMDQGIGSDDTDELKRILNRSKNVIYMFDNCGESQLDRILISEIRKLGVRVVGVVRGEPILNDVTAEDAKRSGLCDDVDRMFTTSQFAIGVDLSKIGDDLKDEISKADMIIAKGMANYESLSDQKINIPVAHILRSKCRPVSESLGVPLGINVVRIRNP